MLSLRLIIPNIILVIFILQMYVHNTSLPLQHLINVLQPTIQRLPDIK